jgi:CheY-like chemotaxis protein
MGVSVIAFASRSLLLRFGSSDLQSRIFLCDIGDENNFSNLSNGIIMLLLFVDDDYERRFLWEMYCKTFQGVSIATAENGATGLALARSLMPTVIFSDFDMPVMNGYTLWQRLRAEEETREIPFVIVSSFISTQGIILNHHASLEEIRRDPHARLLSKEGLKREVLVEIVRATQSANASWESMPGNPR